MSAFQRIMFGLGFIYGCISIVGIGLLCDCPMFAGPTPENTAYMLMIFGGLAMFTVCMFAVAYVDARETERLLARLATI